MIVHTLFLLNDVIRWPRAHVKYGKCSSEGEQTRGERPPKALLCPCVRRDPRNRTYSHVCAFGDFHPHFCRPSPYEFPPNGPHLVHAQHILLPQRLPDHLASCDGDAEN